MTRMHDPTGLRLLAGPNRALARPAEQRESSRRSGAGPAQHRSGIRDPPLAAGGGRRWHRGIRHARFGSLSGCVSGLSAELTSNKAKLV